MASAPADAVVDIEATAARIPSERGIPLNPRFTGEIFDPPHPLIPELAEAAAPLAKTPTAGGYAIARFVLPDIDIPPACMVNEGEFFPFTLEPTPGQGLPQDPVCVTKNIPKELLVSEGDKPYVFTPLVKGDESNANTNANATANATANAADITNLNQRMDADINKLMEDMKLVSGNADTVAEVAELQEMQDQVKLAVQEAVKVDKVPSVPAPAKTRKSASKSPRPGAGHLSAGRVSGSPSAVGRVGVGVGRSPVTRVGGSPAGRSSASPAGRPSSKGPVPRSGSKGRVSAPGQTRPTPPPPNPKPSPKKSTPTK